MADKNQLKKDKNEENKLKAIKNTFRNVSLKRIGVCLGLSAIASLAVIAFSNRDNTLSTNKDISKATPQIFEDNSIVKTAKATTPSAAEIAAKEKAALKKKLKIKGFKVKKQMEKKVKLKWKKNKKAKYFEVYRTVKGKNKYKYLGKTKKNSFKDKTAKARKNYQYKIKAHASYQGSDVAGNFSKKKKAYTYPQTPRTVVIGECFVVGMKLYTESMFNKKTLILGKGGLNSLQILQENYFSYKGSSVSAAERAAYHRPDRIVVLVGMNEVRAGNPNATISNFGRLFKLMKKINPKMQMVVLSIPPIGTDTVLSPESKARIPSFNKHYKKFADKKNNVFYCDAPQKLLSDSSGNIKSYANGGDGIHWTGQATADVVSGLKKFCKKNMGTW
ncbi:MAG: hypothetical protein K6D02_04995 [Lachnospiraceae bacterium]|nr:hypothetical protein [Lachnospiraceae bacterium]